MEARTSCVLANFSSSVPDTLDGSGKLQWSRWVTPANMRQRSAPGFVATGDHMAEQRAGLDVVEHTFRLIVGNINTHLQHRFDDNRIEFARLQSSAVRFKILAVDSVQDGSGHLAAGAIVNADN